MDDGTYFFPVSKLSEASIVQLADGRIGYIGRGNMRGSTLIVFADDSGMYIRNTEQVRLVKASFALANKYLKEQANA